ncbi:unnamed protein product [Chrysodeixis includens]|uniref:Uncharacterized protein n=1 Tax=Chrysodeixis includens TaxID=689277 RepID=A0A9N8KR30_CHRIL|nr:unnamed protein product [Chrysodeixis includens]
MEGLANTFKNFLDGGARVGLLSEEFRQDVEMGEVTETDIHNSPHRYRSIRDSGRGFVPDHDLADSDIEDDRSSAGSFNDPLNDEAKSILSSLENIAAGRDIEPAWEGSSHVIWTSPGVYPTEEFRSAMKLLLSVIRSINRDSGSSYIVNVGRPDTLFITRADSLTISKGRNYPCKARSPSPATQPDDCDLKSLIELFAQGIRLRDKDEPGKFLTVNLNTPGFNTQEIKTVYLKGIKTVGGILEHIWVSKGRWNYIRSSYDVSHL